MITRISAVEGIYGKVKASTEALLAVARSREAAAARTQQAIDEATETIQAFTAAARAAIRCTGVRQRRWRAAKVLALACGKGP